LWYNYISWWDNITRYTEENIYFDDLNETKFVNFSLQVEWVFYGEFEYEEVFGELGAYYIQGRQLVLLDKQKELVCFVFSQDHWVG
jgi:hypothetical protein